MKKRGMLKNYCVQKFFMTLHFAVLFAARQVLFTGIWYAAAAFPFRQLTG
jgi:hypothetical protein